MGINNCCRRWRHEMEALGIKADTGLDDAEESVDSGVSLAIGILSHDPFAGLEDPENTITCQQFHEDLLKMALGINVILDLAENNESNISSEQKILLRLLLFALEETAEKIFPANKNDRVDLLIYQNAKVLDIFKLDDLRNLFGRAWDNARAAFDIPKLRTNTTQNLSMREENLNLDTILNEPNSAGDPIAENERWRRYEREREKLMIEHNVESSTESLNKNVEPGIGFTPEEDAAFDKAFKEM
ncbi:MAG: hypothetical protein NTZ80_03220 [Patescibacteria group bacterium]|nr:hypothetical protein [Patescibacteria group bacterium]